MQSILANTCTHVDAASAKTKAPAGWCSDFLLAAMPEVPVLMQAGTVRLRCIIVDDNPEFLRAARALLETEQISVVAAVSTGAQAVRSCFELQPDVALVDVDLGAENGFDVARDLADLGGRRTPQVIVISASPATEFGELIDASPAASFLSKPDLSAAAIDEILARASHSCCGRS